jgi:hypothetical protein
VTINMRRFIVVPLLLFATKGLFGRWFCEFYTASDVRVVRNVRIVRIVPVLNHEEHEGHEDDLRG